MKIQYIVMEKSMKIIVISDSHGNREGIDKIFKFINFDYLIFLGDGLKDLGDYVYLDNVIAVCGNCDLFSDMPDTRIFNAEGKLILITHGHKFGVKSTLNHLKEKAKEENCDIALFGHTHVPYIENWHDIYIANPGTFQRKPNNKCSALEINIVNGKIDIKPIWIDLSK